MTESYDHEYPPAEWSADGIAAALREADETYPIPTYADEAFWRSVREDDDLRGMVDAAHERAAEVADDPVVPLTASGYLHYKREGARAEYPADLRRKNLSALVFAECLEREGRYLDPITDYLWDMCNQPTWTQPQHLSEDGAEYREGLPRPVSPADRQIELRSAGAAKRLAEVTYVLGDRLHPAVRERVHHEIDRKVLTPYLANGDFSWLDSSHNHNAVCNGSVLIAALHAIEDADRQARIVARAVESMGHYLGGFGADGCTPEGIHYWKYGFAFYTMAAAHLEGRTDGAYSLFSPPVVREIADFPLRIELSRNRFPPFSDASEETDITPYIACKLGRRLGLDALAARGREDVKTQSSVGYFSSALRDAAWSRFEVGDDAPSPARRSLFRDQQWWVARAEPEDAEGLAVAAKGGHNGEPHNHNDVGTFVCHYRRESLLTDPGPGEYDSGYFGDGRYSYFATRSLGHSVPFVNGYEQSAGDEFGATVCDVASHDDTEQFALDITDCYPAEAGLDALRREFELDRTAGSDGRLRVTDRARFAPDAPDTDLTGVLVSRAPMTFEGDRLVVTGERSNATVSFDTDLSPAVERVDDHSTGGDVWRARLPAADAGREASLEVTVTPEPLGPSRR
jgi:hypothetical protein